MPEPPVKISDRYNCGDYTEVTDTYRYHYETPPNPNIRLYSLPVGAHIVPIQVSMHHPIVIRIIPIGVVMNCTRHPPNSVNPVIIRVHIETQDILHADTIAITDQKTATRHNAIDPNGHMIRGMILPIPQHDMISEQVPTILFITPLSSS